MNTQFLEAHYNCILVNKVIHSMQTKVSFLCEGISDSVP